VRYRSGGPLEWDHLFGIEILVWREQRPSSIKGFQVHAVFWANEHAEYLMNASPVSPAYLGVPTTVYGMDRAEAKRKGIM
jgi:hypothetical protein